MHPTDDSNVGNPRMEKLPINKCPWDDCRYLAAAIQHGISDHTHEPNLTTEHKAMPTLRKTNAQLGRCSRKRSIPAG